RAEIVAADQVFPSVAVEIDVIDGLGPAGVVDAAAGGDILEDEVAFVAKELIGKAVHVAARERRQDAVDVVAEVADVEVEESVFVEVEGGGGTADESFAAEVRAGGDVLELGVTQILVETVIVVGVGDEDVRETVIVKVGDDWLARLAGAAVGTFPIQTSRFGDVGE